MFACVYIYVFTCLRLHIRDYCNISLRIVEIYLQKFDNNLCSVFTSKKYLCNGVYRKLYFLKFGDVKVVKMVMNASKTFCCLIFFNI